MKPQYTKKPSDSASDLAEKLGFDFIYDMDPEFNDKMDETHKIVQSYSELIVLVDESVRMLIKVSEDDKDLTENRMVFVDEKIKPHVRNIGEIIHKAGEKHAEGFGFRLMQYVASKAGLSFVDQSDSRVLEFAWNNIGEWQA